MAYYDLSTAIGRCRFHLADVATSDALFSDQELDYLIGLFGGNATSAPLLAAAAALEAAANDVARVAVIVSQDTTKTDPTKVPDLLRAGADRLRALASTVDIESLYVAATLNGPDRIFSTDAEDGRILGTMTGW